MRKLLNICWIVLLGILACEPSKRDIYSSGTTLFQLLPSSSTGITFSNDLHYTEDFNPYTYRNFYNGGGVGLGDINNDGLLDIYFCGNQVDNKLYLNKGNFKFEDITDKAGVACHGVWSSGVAIVDINGDGWQDIYVCKSGKPGGRNRHNELFINNGDLSFTEQSAAYGLNTLGLSTHAAFFDYDRDGDLDCYLLNNSIRTVGAYDLRKDLRLIPDTLGGNKLLRNDEGHFVDVSRQAGIYSSAIGFGLGVSVGDLNGDTWPDLYVSNDFFERDYLYLNQKDCTFKESIESAMSEISLNSMGADIADADNDGLPEVFVTDMLPETDARYKTKTTFENWEKYQRNLQNGYHHQFIRNVFQWNRGNLKFSEISRYAGVYATDWSWGALICDFDMDGYKDIFVANGIYKDLTDQDYLNLYNDPETILGLMKKENQVILKLIDAIPSEKIPNYAFKNSGDLTFKNKASDWGLAEPSFSNGSAYGDLDNDGDPDLVVNNVSMPSFVYRNNLNDHVSAHYLQFELTGKGKNTKAIGTQITLFKDQQKFFQEVHPMRGFESCVDPRPLFGLGTISMVDSIHFTWPDGHFQSLGATATNQVIKLSQTENLNAVAESTAQFSNILTPVTLPGLDFVHQENTFNDFERDRLLFHMISREGPALAIADFNGDHLDDIYLGNAMNALSTLFIQQKNGSFIKKSVPAFETDKGSEDTDAIGFDADGDGDQDLYVCSGGNEVPVGSSLLADRLYFNDGKGNFTKSPQILPTFNFESSSCVKSCDYDRDGDMDLFVGIRLVPFNYGVPCNGYILQNDGKGNYKLLEVPALKKIGMITDAAWTDIDGDQDQDLIVVGEWMPVTVLINENNSFHNATNDFGLLQTTGLWQSVIAGDLDGDGDQDLVAGNWGLNTRIKSNPLQPAQLTINDFDQNGSAEQILSVFNGDQAYPLTLRQDLVSQMPGLKKKYLRFESYKNQTLENIFTPAQLDNAINLSCSTGVTTIYYNQDHRFLSKPLPMEAQLAPVFSILMDDLNGDGLPDLVLGGNFSGSKPEIGSYMSQGLSVYIQTSEREFEYQNQHKALHQEIRNIRKLKIGLSGYIIAALNQGKPLVLGIETNQQH